MLAEPAWDAICYVCNGIYWLFTDVGSLSVLWLLLKVLFWSSLLVGSLAMLAKIGWLQRFFEALGIGFSKLAPPFYLVGKLFSWICGGFKAVGDFVSMFYEENCPPIKLVSPEEAAIEEKIVQEGT
jgi:hypothetical protein